MSARHFRLWNGYFAYYLANLFFILCFFTLSLSLFMLLSFYFFVSLWLVHSLSFDCCIHLHCEARRVSAWFFKPTISYCNLNIYKHNHWRVCEQYVSARYQFSTMSVYLNQKNNKKKKKPSVAQEREEWNWRAKKNWEIKLILNNCCKIKK